MITEFGIEVKKIMKENGLTYESLSDLIRKVTGESYSPAYFSEVFRNKKQTNLKFCKSILEVMNYLSYPKLRIKEVGKIGFKSINTIRLDKLNLSDQDRDKILKMVYKCQKII